MRHACRVPQMDVPDRDRRVVVRGPFASRGVQKDRGRPVCGGVISLQPLAGKPKGTWAASERVAGELAVQRLDEEIPALKARVEQ